ncbi:MAG: LCP family protein [Chloroflexi bacterium]|nr:LCP family protein [Chloroflexota bacterium]
MDYRIFPPARLFSHSSSRSQPQSPNGSRVPGIQTTRPFRRALSLALTLAVATALCVPSVQARGNDVPAPLSPASVTSPEQPAAAAAPEVELPEGTINIALLGVDKRPSRNFNNTDVIIIASINPDVPAVTLLSIPRDWPVNIPGVGVSKVNTAYGYGGPELFFKTIRNNFGLKLDHYALINFEGLVHAVDTLGGIEAIATCRLFHIFPKDPYYMGNTVTVMQDYTDTFTGEVWKRGTRVPTLTIDIPKAGVYTLNGLESLAFIRARYGVPGGDVDRGRREQRVVRALFTKAKQINAIPKFPELLTQFQQYVKTDLPLDKLLYFVSIADRFTDGIIRSRFLDDGGANGAVLELENGTNKGGTWSSIIQQMLDVALNQRPNDGIPIEVWNGTNDPGFGSAAVDRLSELGFRVIEVKAADKLYDQTVVIDYNTTQKGSAVSLLQRTFGIAKANIISEPNKDGPRYRIIIGPDFKTCYYDDSYVLKNRTQSEITDPSVDASTPATPTILLTPAPTAEPPVVVTETQPVSPSIPATTTEPLEPPTAIDVSVPLGDLVNVRNGPGVRYPVIGQLSQEQSAPVTGKSEDGQWWRINFQSQQGWVAADFVQLTGDPATVPSVTVPLLPMVVVPVGDIVNVRSGPSTGDTIILRLGPRQSALISGKSADGEWWQIRLGNLVGWVSAQYVQVTGDITQIKEISP